MEVDDQSNIQLEKSEVGNQLSLVDAMNFVLCFTFDNYQLLNKKVCPERTVNFQIVIHDRYRFFLSDAKFEFLQFIG